MAAVESGNGVNPAKVCFLYFYLFICSNRVRRVVISC